MKKLLGTCLFLSQLSWAQGPNPEPSAPAASTASAATECTQGKVSRSVEVRSTSSSGAPCEVVYKKETGEEKVIYNAQNDASYCSTKKDEFLARLRDLGWTCP